MKSVIPYSATSTPPFEVQNARSLNITKGFVPIISGFKKMLYEARYRWMFWEKLKDILRAGKYSILDSETYPLGFLRSLGTSHLFQSTVVIFEVSFLFVVMFHP